MSIPEPSRPRPARIRRAQPCRHEDYRWTRAKALAFLEALAACGKVAAAARAVGMTRQSAYRLKARSPLVAQGWPLALAAGRARRLRHRKVTVSRAQGDAFAAKVTLSRPR